MALRKVWLAPLGLLVLMVGRFADEACRAAIHIPVPPGQVVLRHWPAAEADETLRAALNASRAAADDASDQTITHALRRAEELLCLHLDVIQANGKPLNAQESRNYWDGVQAMLGSQHATARSAVAGLRSFTKELDKARNSGELSGELIAAARCGYTASRDAFR